MIEKAVEPKLRCDGYVEPVGNRFDDGFRIVIKGGLPPARQRFTLAHEICHTFFYEFVPEVKFTPHETDSAEEMLCNYGAAELLIPSEDLKTLKSGDVSLSMLEELSSRYGVSIETMFIRLRELQHWSCELTVWHRMTSGEFLIDRMHSRFKANWRWVDTSIPDRAWEAKGSKPISGRSFVYLQDERGYSAARPVYYQIKRRGESLVTIWSARELQRPQPSPMLFDIPATTKSTRQNKRARVLLPEGQQQ